MLWVLTSVCTTQISTIRMANKDEISEVTHFDPPFLHYIHEILICIVTVVDRPGGSTARAHSYKINCNNVKIFAESFHYLIEE